MPYHAELLHSCTVWQYIHAPIPLSWNIPPLSSALHGLLCPQLALAAALSLAICAYALPWTRSRKLDHSIEAPYCQGMLILLIKIYLVGGLAAACWAMR